jgi:hypothetical protein
VLHTTSDDQSHVVRGSATHAWNRVVIGTSLGRLAAHQTLSIPSWAIGIRPSYSRRNDPSTQRDLNVLKDFVKSSQPWSREGVRLPLRLTCLLWALTSAELAWGIWLMTVLTGDSRCDGRICAVATLGNHQGLLLVCVAVCIAGIAVLAPGTHGLSRCNGRQVAGVAVASAAGGVAMLGIAALIVSAAIGLIVLGAVAVIAVSTFAEPS